MSDTGSKGNSLLTFIVLVLLLIEMLLNLIAKENMKTSLSMKIMRGSDGGGGGGGGLRLG